jgi:single-stranded-DNA-specific exonuclease
MQKRWAISENTDEEAISLLAAALNIDPVLGKLLVQRGIDNYDDARYGESD